MKACKRCVHWSPDPEMETGICEKLAESELVIPCVAIEGADEAIAQHVTAFETDGDFFCQMFEGENFPVTRWLVNVADRQPELEET